MHGHRLPGATAFGRYELPRASSQASSIGLRTADMRSLHPFNEDEDAPDEDENDFRGLVDRQLTGGSYTTTTTSRDDGWGGADASRRRLGSGGAMSGQGASFRGALPEPIIRYRSSDGDSHYQEHEQGNSNSGGKLNPTSGSLLSGRNRDSDG